MSYHSWSVLLQELSNLSIKFFNKNKVLCVVVSLARLCTQESKAEGSGFKGSLCYTKSPFLKQKP